MLSGRYIDSRCIATGSGAVHEFCPTLRRQHYDAGHSAQIGRAFISKNHLDGLSPPEGPIAWSLS